MTIDVSTQALIGASLFVGGQLVTLASVVRSNRDQGRRLGAVERWQARHDAIREYREKRASAPVHGVPTHADEC